MWKFREIWYKSTLASWYYLTKTKTRTFLILCTYLFLVFFHLQGSIRYEISGVYPAETFFFISPTQGVIVIRNSLKSDSLQATEYTVSGVLCVVHICLSWPFH